MDAGRASQLASVCSAQLMAAATAALAYGMPLPPSSRPAAYSDWHALPGGGSARAGEQRRQA